MSQYTLPPDAPVLRAVLLDTCNLWIENLVTAGVRVIVPEIADYEVRRELLQARLYQSIAALEEFTASLEYLPLDTETMRQAAAFWAQVRQAGRPTADGHALDGDAILAAQAASFGYASDEVIVATTNVGHLSQFVTARVWQKIA